MRKNSNRWNFFLRFFQSLENSAFSLIELIVVVAILAVVASLLMPALLQGWRASLRAKCASNVQQLFVANKLYAGDTGSYVAAEPDILGKNLMRWHGVQPNKSSPFDGSKGALAPYLGYENKIRACPAMQNFQSGFEASCGGYGYNDRGVGTCAYLEGFDNGCSTGMSPGAIVHPLATVMFTDTAFLQTKRGQSYLIEYSFAEAPYFVAHDAPVQGEPATPTIHFRHDDKANVVWCDGHVSAEVMTTTYDATLTKNKIGWFGGYDNLLFDPF